MYVARRTLVWHLAGAGASAVGLAVLGAGLIGKSASAPRKVPNIGILASDSEGMTPYLFSEALGKLGWVDGQSIALDYRVADAGDPEQWASQVADLVARRVDLLVVSGAPRAALAIHATATIPIIFVQVGDPIGKGLVASIAHPGGNVTGIALQAPEYNGSKHLELLKVVIPGLRRVGILNDPASPATPAWLEAIQHPADALGLTVQRSDVRTAEDLPPAFESALSWGAQGIELLPDGLLVELRHQIAAVALQTHLPTVGGMGFVVAGALLGYGPSTSDSSRLAAMYADKVLRGVKPADLPVQQPTSFGLGINLKTAQALRITIPADVAAQVTQWVQ
jgi:putative ABC transport system substrate-binding protein